MNHNGDHVVLIIQGNLHKMEKQINVNKKLFLRNFKKLLEGHLKTHNP